MRLKDNFYKNRFTILRLLLLITCPFSVHAQTNSKAYGKASYIVASPGTFMRNWLVAGPVFINADKSEPNTEIQEQSFKSDPFTSIKVVNNSLALPSSIQQQQLKWEPISSSHDIVDLDAFYKQKDFVYTYAVAEIVAASPSKVILALGSDDGIKVWHNGKLVHDNWIPRGVNKDDDLVPLQLVKGSNQLLLKVQDMAGGWAFIARLLDKDAFANLLNQAAGSGNIEKIKLLLEGGADVNAVNKSGISPIMAAKVSGRKGVVDMLLKNGAVDKPVASSISIADDQFNILNGKLAPGVAVLVARDGEVLYRKGFGYADIQNKILIEPDTKFRIGSVTKQFTAAAILKLQEKNLLSVDDKLSKYIPDFPRGDEVTIHHLLTHTSGIHSYTGKHDFIDRVVKTISPDSLISYFKNDPYDFNPGERMQYNNSGYFLLGYIIEKVSGKPYDRYLKDSFFDPLKMTNTGVHYAGIKLEKEAKGYSKNQDKFDNTLNWDMSWAGAAGALYSTVDDLLKWNQALYGGKVLEKKSLDAALTPTVLKNGTQPSMRYGYGLGLNKYRGEDIIIHGGGLHGFITQLVYYPKEKMTVVMFSNTDNPEVSFDPHKLAEAFLWSKLEEQSSYAAADKAPANLSQYVGRFEIPNVGVIMVSTDNNRIYAQLADQGKFEIFPSTITDEFFWKVVDARIKFTRDASTKLTGAVLSQNGQDLVAKKLDEETIIQVDPAILDNYLGNYKLTENVVVTVTKENNKLYAKPTGQSKLELFAVSESNFIIKELNAKLSFIKSENGKINKIRLFMNGTESELPRVD